MKDGVNRILGTPTGSRECTEEEIPFLMGQAVEIIEGPSGFQRRRGRSDSRQGQGEGSVSLFGRPTTVELDYLQLRGH